MKKCLSGSAPKMADMLHNRLSEEFYFILIRVEFLWRAAISRHHVQHYDATEDTFLHGQLNHSVHRDHLFDRIGLLPSVRFRRKGIPFLSIVSGPIIKGRGLVLYSAPRPLGQSGHIDPSVADCVLPPASRDHSADQSGSPSAGQIRPLYHDPRHFQVWSTTLLLSILRWHSTNSLSWISVKYLRDSRRAERALPFPTNAHYVSMGSSGVYSHLAEAPHHASASLL